SLTLEGNFLIAGELQVDLMSFHGRVLEVSPEGRVLKDIILGPPGVTGFNTLALLPDYSVIVGGMKEGKSWLVKFDAHLEKVWEKELAELEEVNLVRAISKDQFFVMGLKEKSTLGLGRTELLKLDSSGALLDEHQLPNQVNRRGELSALTDLPNQKWIAAGTLGEPDLDAGDLWVVKLDKAGEVIWEKT